MKAISNPHCKQTLAGRQWLSVAAFLLVILAQVAFAQSGRAQVDGVKNFGRVTDKYFRSGALSEEGIENLAGMGVRTIVDLRDKSDTDEPQICARFGIKYYNFPMTGHDTPDDRDIKQILSIVQNAKAPVLVHCSAGKHSAGTLAALYRIRVQGWPQQRAWAEQQSYGFGSADGHPQLYAYVYGRDALGGEKLLANKSSRKAKSQAEAEDMDEGEDADDAQETSRSAGLDGDEQRESPKSKKKSGEEKAAKSKKKDDDDGDKDDDDDDGDKDNDDDDDDGDKDDDDDSDKDDNDDDGDKDDDDEDKSDSKKERKLGKTAKKANEAVQPARSETVTPAAEKAEVLTSLAASVNYIPLAEAVQRARSAGGAGAVLQLDLEWDLVRDTPTWDITLASGVEYEIDALSGKVLGQKPKAATKLAALTPLPQTERGRLTFQQVLRKVAAQKLTATEIELKQPKGRPGMIYEISLADGGTLFLDAVTGEPVDGI
jgi:protein tyrosine phosphatase (PTP) superfamily phosphohydrolase (DUF442 family)